jgi:hypothetical protein
MRLPNALRSVAACAALLILLGAASPPKPLEGYRGAEELLAAATELAAQHPRLASIRMLGRSTEGRDIAVMTLGAERSDRPALLVAAGLDGTHLLGPELALRVAERLLVEHPAALEDRIVHIIFAANPDAIEATRRGPHAVSTTSRPVDDDRDGREGEDPPVDLDGDGVILSMRVRNPPPPYLPTLVTDDKDPRVLRAPDPAKGERAQYLLLAESIDADGDGRFGEDPPGGVDLDRNFPHRWPEFAKDAGPFQISEPESKLLADFVIATPELVAAIVYGRHDSLVAVPDNRDMDATGRTPMVLLAADHPIYQALGTLYRDTTGQKRAEAGDVSGSFWIWLANHRGLLAMAANGWGRPDAPPAEAPAADAPAAETSPAAQPTPEPPPVEAMPAPAPAPQQRRGARGGGRAAAAPRQESKPVEADFAAWIDYLERERDGLGFVAWREVPHPVFGTVEVGGIDPLVKRNPPASELEQLAEKQTAFLVELLERMPRLEVGAPTVTRLGPGLWRVETTVANIGRLPTATRMGRTTQALPPIVARVSTPVDRVPQGDRVRRIDGIDPGESVVLSWILRTEPGEEVRLSIGSPAFGRTEFAIRDGEVSSR